MIMLSHMRTGLFFFFFFIYISRLTFCVKFNNNPSFTKNKKKKKKKKTCFFLSVSEKKMWCDNIYLKDSYA
jgi:uncharacterized membrane protein